MLAGSFKIFGRKDAFVLVSSWSWFVTRSNSRSMLVMLSSNDPPNNLSLKLVLIALVI